MSLLAAGWGVCNPPMLAGRSLRLLGKKSVHVSRQHSHRNRHLQAWAPPASYSSAYDPPPSNYSSSPYGSPLPPPSGYSSAYDPTLQFGTPVVDPELRELQASAGTQRTLSFVAFWLQLSLSISAAAVLLFAAGFTPRVAGSATAAGMDLSKWLALVGIVLAFVSSFFAHGFLNLAQKLQSGQAVSRAWITRTLITNNTLNLAGVIATAVALQASVGTLVAKTLMASTSGIQAYQYQSVPTLVSIDVFGLQASTNSLLCHIVSLVFTNIMLRIITPKAAPPTSTTVNDLGATYQPPIRG